jgi:6-phospho-3-hexuloisomerase
VSPTIERLEAVLAEMRAVFARMQPDTMDRFVAELLQAPRVFLCGSGRNGLILQALTMRLTHVGIEAHFVGQLSTPPAKTGDLVIAGVALGRLPTMDAILATARVHGARTLVISARPQLVPIADVVIELPAQTMADPMTSVLALGSPFELALSIFCDLAVAELMQRLGRTNDELLARHANLL